MFLKMGLVLYGSGYLLVAYMQADLVNRLGWLSMQQMLDVVAIGQMTPGPFLTTATAAGMVIASFPGGLAA
ncbi:MAG: putative chromate transport protein [Firmicutes bacterium]|nr:putative chromate transport protein [Bacillota bacterium]